MKPNSKEQWSTCVPGAGKSSDISLLSVAQLNVPTLKKYMYLSPTSSFQGTVSLRLHVLSVQCAKRSVVIAN